MRLILLVAVLVSAAFGQEPVWRVMAGDDPAYARPDFDDSGWEVPGPGSTAAQVQRIAGVRWRRATLVVPEAWRVQTLAVGMGPLLGAYEVYVEGVRVGTFGAWTPKLALYPPRHQTFGIPTELTGTGQVHIAIRYFTRSLRWYWSIHTIAGGLRNGHSPALGPANQIAQTESLHAQAGFTQLTPTILLLLMNAACGLLCLGFYFSQRRQRELLWFGLWLTSEGLAYLGGFVGGLSFWFPMYGLVGTGLVVCRMGFACWITWCLAELVPPEASRSRRFLFFAGASLGAAHLVQVLLHSADSPLYLIQTQSTLYGLQLLAALWAAAICLRRGLVEAAALGGAAALPALATVLNTATGLRFQVAGVNFRTSFVSFQSFEVDLINLAEAATALVMTIILWRRYRRERARLLEVEMDLKAARTVQQLLFTGGAPGVEAVYRPAQEVGGDFYQVLDLEGGARLVAVGDVSGKGLRAAMVVSLVVGLLRSYRELPPAALLAHVNRQLVGTLDGGFVTCLVIRQESDGRTVMANAGHLMPYSAGVEVAVEPGLPLGIVETEYGETAGRFDSLMLLSDGVVEAAKADGELFGFERVRAMSGRPAAEIAEAAQAWGQNDDITVVTAGRVAA